MPVPRAGMATGAVVDSLAGALRDHWSLL